MTSGQFIAALTADLQPALRQVEGLEQVTVHVVEGEDTKAPAVVLIRARVNADIEYAAMGPVRTDTVTVPGFVRSYSTTLQDAVDEALAIVDAVGGYLRDTPPTVGDNTLDAMVNRLGWVPFPSDKGGWFVDCEYDIEYTADIP